MIISGIYKIQSVKKPERIYIGSAANTDQRKRDHYNHLRKNKHYNKRLQQHFNEFGESDLVFSVLLGCEKENLIIHEQFFIDVLNPYFNICRIAGNTLGRIHSEKTREKISKRTKGRIAWNKGLHHSQETKDKIADKKRGKPGTRLGKKCSEETKRKIREARKGMKPRLGAKLSEETKAKISKSGIGKHKISPELRIKINQSLVRRKLKMALLKQ